MRETQDLGEQVIVHIQHQEFLNNSVWQCLNENSITCLLIPMIVKFLIIKLFI